MLRARNTFLLRKNRFAPAATPTLSVRNDGLLVILSLLKKRRKISSLKEIFLLRLTPCNPLGRYAQYDKIQGFI
ncbi:hypothetical protein [Campylobacter troglodytis]|uniref:hypothetical protein n=1 Tax=Campylobacter troglodytis TaxID=654363 RepID=UPI001159E8D1|nr:hypothetical protein [Campylobacter troglodytis]